MLILSFFLYLGCIKKAEKITIEKKAFAKKQYAIVIHGGAGTILKKNMTKEQELAYNKILDSTLNEACKLLEKGASSLDAIQKAITIMEDSPLFNAGKGAVFNSEGKHELDASIMDGKTLNSGAVAGVSKIKNPINAARIVMDSSRHVMMSGKGAEIFASKYNIEFVAENYFDTEKRYLQLLDAQKKDLIQLDHSKEITSKDTLIDNHKFGTVGAVALDQNGTIAAATSTGGMTNKKYGRIGDSPIIGAGTYANNKTCGVSSTGTGEYYIRTVAAHEVSNLLQYKNLSLKNSLKIVIHDQIGKLGGSGGMIAMDTLGNYAWDFNTEGMYRGYQNSEGTKIIKLYED